MNALTVVPGQPNSAALVDVPEVEDAARPVIVETLAIGICGTDIDIIQGAYGWPPDGHERLVLGHESLGRVMDAPPNCGLAKGDLVVGIVRRPDPVPCPSCAVGEWDMCRNGRYTECGIKQRDGFCCERFGIEADFVIKLDPRLARVGVLLEPTSIVAKAWEHIERIGIRAHWQPRRVLVTGAGPVGLLAALLGRQRGLDVHVLDRVTAGPKPQLVRDLGATYHSGSPEDAGRGADIVLECTGVGSLVYDVIKSAAPGAVVCLTGISSGGRTVCLDPSQLNREMVLENEAVFGSVNANRRHYQAAAEALAKADLAWLERLITRRVPLSRWQEVMRREAGDVKSVIDFTMDGR